MTINGYRLEKTCGGCPEQYDVYDSNGASRDQGPPRQSEVGGRRMSVSSKELLESLSVFSQQDQLAVLLKEAMRRLTESKAQAALADAALEAADGVATAIHGDDHKGRAELWDDANEALDTYYPARAAYDKAKSEAGA